MPHGKSMLVSAFSMGFHSDHSKLILYIGHSIRVSTADYTYSSIIISYAKSILMCHSASDGKVVILDCSDEIKLLVSKRSFSCNQLYTNINTKHPRNKLEKVS